MKTTKTTTQVKKTSTVVAVKKPKLIKTHYEFGINKQGKPIMIIDTVKRTIDFNLYSQTGHLVNKIKDISGMGRIPTSDSVSRTSTGFLALMKKSGFAIVEGKLGEAQSFLIKQMDNEKAMAQWNEEIDNGSISRKF